MPINAHPEYIAAEKEYALAQTLDDKIEKLKKMISVAPSHKGAENLRAQLKTRLKKLTSQKEKQKKKGATKKGIKKEDIQAVLVGKTNAGKSTILASLTNVNPKISPLPFTTTEPLVGMMPVSTINIQLVEIPATNSENYDRGMVHTADTILLVVTSFDDIKPLLKKVENDPGKKIILYNNLTNEDKRKLEARLKSNRYDFVFFENQNPDALKYLKEKIFESAKILRIFTKEPSKPKSSKPILMRPGATVADVAEKILKGFSKKVTQTKIWGPSSKFGGQVVGLKHTLKDLDIVEFKTK